MAAAIMRAKAMCSLYGMEVRSPEASAPVQVTRAMSSRISLNNEKSTSSVRSPLITDKVPPPSQSHRDFQAHWSSSMGSLLGPHI